MQRSDCHHHVVKLRNATSLHDHALGTASTYTFIRAVIIMETSFSDKAAKSESFKVTGPSFSDMNLIACGLTEGSGWVYSCCWIVLEMQLLA